MASSEKEEIVRILAQVRSITIVRDVTKYLMTVGLHLDRLVIASPALLPQYQHLVRWTTEMNVQGLIGSVISTHMNRILAAFYVSYLDNIVAGKWRLSPCHLSHVVGKC
jgi:hypothetical protein